MLKIIEGGFYSSAWDEVKRDILNLTERGERLFLIVPEQQAVSAEKELMNHLPPSAPLTFEVTNFTRLANTVYRKLGGISREYSSHAQEALVMWKTLTELSPFLYLTQGGEISSGTVETALMAVKEMKSISATPDMLAEIAKSDELGANARLVRKLDDISKIMTLYEKLLSEKYSSTQDECERLSEKLSQNPGFFADTHFFISGFTSFTEPQYKVIRELLRSSEVSVHLTLPRAEADFFEFTEARSTKEKLISIANKANAEKVIRRAEENTQGDLPISLEKQCQN